MPGFADSLLLPSQGQPPQAAPEKPALAKIMDDPWFQLGMNLLDRSGPQMQPHSFGQDLAGSVGDLRASQGASADRDLKHQQLAQLLQQQQTQQAFQADPQAYMDKMGALFSGGQGAGPQPFVPPNIAPQLAQGTPPAPKPQEQAGQFGDMVQKAADEFGIPVGLFKSLIHSESRGHQMDPNDPSKLFLSKAGAGGLTQLMPGTASDMGVDRNDPYQNLRGGAKYLRQQVDKYGNYYDALRAYNAGPRNADMSPTIAHGYAKGVLDGWPEDDGAPQASAGDPGAPMPADATAQAPATQSVPQGFTPPPADLQRMMLVSAYIQSAGDPEKLMQSFGQQMGEYVKTQMTARMKPTEYGQPIEMRGPDGKPVSVRFSPNDPDPHPVPGGYKPKTPDEEYGQPVEATGPDGKPTWVRFKKGDPNPYPVPGGYKPKTSEAFLDEVEDKDTIDGIAHYRIKMPSSGRNPALYKDTLAKVLRVNPSYDVAKQDARMNMAKEFASTSANKAGGQIQAFNRLSEHLQLAPEAFAALKAGNTPMFNSIAQRIAEETGDPAPTNMDELATFLGNELTKITSGGSGGVEERAANRQIFNRIFSPAQAAGAVKTAQHLAVGALRSLEKKYVENQLGDSESFRSSQLTTAAREMYDATDAELKQSAIPTVTTQAEFDALAPGTRYLEPGDSQVYIKPGAKK